jgi:hypothetical protein
VEIQMKKSQAKTASEDVKSQKGPTETVRSLAA